MQLLILDCFRVLSQDYKITFPSLADFICLSSGAVSLAPELTMKVFVISATFVKKLVHTGIIQHVSHEKKKDLKWDK